MTPCSGFVPVAETVVRETQDLKDKFTDAPAKTFKLIGNEDMRDRKP